LKLDCECSMHMHRGKINGNWWLWRDSRRDRLSSSPNFGVRFAGADIEYVIWTGTGWLWAEDYCGEAIAPEGL
jgi:hypothetical protein